MRLTLKSLDLESIKGLDAFTLDTGGNPSVTVRGTNGTGKTTLFDAYLWALFGRDSSNRTDFEIKPLNPDGSPVHGRDHRVTLRFDLDGSDLVLERVMQEKWTRKRGSATKVLTGHETTYSVDGVPMKKTEYDQALAKLIDEKTFQLLSDPQHFSANLHWQERRKLLLGMVSVEPSDVLAADPEVAEVVEAAGSRSLMDYRRALEAQRRDQRRLLDSVPEAIKEVSRQLTPDVPTVEEAEAALGAAEAAVEAAKRAQAEARLAHAALHQEREELAEADRRTLADHTRRYVAAKGALDLAKMRYDGAKATSEAARKAVADARHAYKEASSGGVCQCCGQTLAQESVDAHLAKLTEAGVALAAKAKESAVAEAEALAKLVAAREAFEGVGEEPRANARIAEIGRLLAEAEPPTSLDASAVADARVALSLARSQAGVLARIEKLRADEEAAIQGFESAERGLWLLARYDQAHARLIEERVDALFGRVSFRMFDRQMNGELAETCVATVNGVPWNDLNTASQVWAGMEIIGALQKHFGAVVPVWVDGRESVVSLPEVDYQVINLMVDPAADKLVVS